MNIAYNADCLAAMREMPDNAFDLAVVDPPYGDAGGGICQPDEIRRKVRQIPRDGFHGKTYGTGGGETSYFRQTKGSESTELVERGRRNSEKNHSVGRCPETGILR